MSSDDELFEDLQRLVSPPFREPPAESVVALRAAVARQFDPKVHRRWWNQKAVVGAALFGLLAGAAPAAFAVSGSLPDPLRTALHAIGLPLDSVAVADTKSAEAELEHALENRDRTEILKAAAHLQTCLSELDGADRARLAPHAESLLRQADPDTDGDVVGSVAPNDREGSGDTNDGSSQVNGGTSNSGDGNEPNTIAPTTSPTPVSGEDSTSDGGDGDQANTTTTIPSAGGQSTTTTTTVQSGSGSDGDGGSSGEDGGSSGGTSDLSH